MARRKSKGSDEPPADDTAEPVTETANEDPFRDEDRGDDRDEDRDEDDVLADLPWLRGPGEDDQPTTARRPAWALPALVAGLVVLILGIYLWNAPVSETADELPASEEATGPEFPTVEQPASRRGTSAQRKASQQTFAQRTSNQPLIQLASYYSRRRAEEYWPVVQKRVKGLAKLRHSVEEGSVNGRTVYRLRASGPGAFEICDRMQSARLDCLRIGH